MTIDLMSCGGKGDMRQYLCRLVGTLSGLLVVFCSLPVAAEEETFATQIKPPSSCYAHPHGLVAGYYTWDAPACTSARIKWKPADTHIKAVAESEVSTSNALTIMLSTESSSLPQQVDTKGLAFVTNGLAQQPANAQSVWLPKGTLFPVHTMQSYSTFEARPDGKLRFELDQDVVVNGFLVAMKGDTAEGSFPDVKSGRNFFFVAHSGSLFQVSVDAIFNFCGDKIDVTFDRTEYRTGRLGPFDSDMDQHIIRGQQYVSFTARPQRACGVPTRQRNDPLSPAALYPTTH